MSMYAAGQIYIWEGGSLWIGRTFGTTEEHEHHAIQITLALEGTFRIRTPGDDDWVTHTAAIIPPHLPHALSGDGAGLATTFVEPEASDGQVLLERFGLHAAARMPSDLAERAAATFRSARGDWLQEAPLVAAAHEAVRILTGGARPRIVVDERIGQAISLIRDRLDRPMLQEEIAEAVFLSPSRFRHLFVEQTGMAFRPYVLWLRLHRALEAYTSGSTLTTAAHAAGFSDLAHLSRTFRRMFGVTPAMLEQVNRYDDEQPVHSNPSAASFKSRRGRAS